MFRAVGNSLLALLSPQACQICSLVVEERSHGVACANCWTSTRIFDDGSVLCHKCGAYSGSGSGAKLTDLRCHQCDEHSYDQAVAVGVYEKALAATVIHLKSTPFLPATAQNLLNAAFDRGGFMRSTLIVPVPLSRRRTLERGFNQAEVIGRAVSTFSGIPMDTRSLARTHHSPAHRVGMDMKARELTVRNTFEVRRPKLIAGQNVLLVDDVFTSGSTTSNCAKVLKKHGAVRVDVLTLARAVIH